MPPGARAALYACAATRKQADAIYHKMHEAPFNITAEKMEDAFTGLSPAEIQVPELTVAEQLVLGRAVQGESLEWFTVLF
jgi:hypothetical protein